MRRFLFITLLIIILVGAFWVLKKGPSFRIWSRGSRNPPVIGIVVRGRSYLPGVDGFKSKMRELGYVEGKTVVYNILLVDKYEEIAPAITKILQAGATLFLTYSTPVTLEAAKQANGKIPIVFGSVGDPMATGLIDSLQHPGRNVTGVSSLSVSLVAKRLEFLKEAFPSINKVALAFQGIDIPGRESYDIARDAGKRLGVEVVPYYITKDRDVVKTAGAISRRDVDGIVLSADSLTWANLSVFIDTAKKEQLPFAVFDRNMVEQGGVIGYGPDYSVSGQQAALIVHKILSGEEPANIPVENPSRLILAVNLKAARDIGITIPDSFLVKADLIYR